MAGRRDYYFRQKVTEAELDAGFDGSEDADKIFAVDFGQFGVISPGMLVTEFAVPNLTLDVSAGVGYSKTGERINVTPAQNVDVSQDENGSSTSVSAGNERWVQIEARFDRILSDPRIDGNGATVNFIRAEGFELAVVMGAEATTGNGVKPPVPSQHLLLVDFLMTPSKTSVVNGDLVFTRRDDFVFTSGANISVNPAGWTELAGTDVQAALDAADVLLISRDGSGNIDETILPDATGRDWGATGNRWDVFANDLDVLKIILGISSRTTGNLLPEVTATDNLGSTSLRYGTVNAGNGNFTGAMTVGTAMDADNFTATKATLPLAYAMNAAVTVTKRQNLHGAFFDSTTGPWDTRLQLTVHAGGARDLITVNTTTAKIATLELDIPDGVTIKSAAISWAQDTGSIGAVSAQLFRVSNAGVRTSIGAAGTLGSDDTWVDDDSFVTGLSEVVDLSTSSYIVVVTSATYAAAADTYVSGYEITYEMTDVGVAASA